MRRLLTILLIILPLTITCFSQNTLETIPQDSTVSITYKQLKYANLIFNEHSKLTIENKLLCEEIDGLHKSLLISEDIIHNKDLVIDHYDYLNSSYELQIKKLNQDIKKKNKTILGLSIGGASITAGLLLFILLK